MRKNVNNGTIEDKSSSKKAEKTVKKKDKIRFGYIIICFVVLLLIVIGITVVLITKDNTKASIKLETHSYEIYEWQYEIKDKNIVKFVEKERYGDLADKRDGKVIEEYIFKSLKPGKTIIEFTFVNKNNKSFLDIKAYEAKVDKKLHLTITEIKNE